MSTKLTSENLLTRTLQVIQTSINARKNIPQAFNRLTAALDKYETHQQQRFDQILTELENLGTRNPPKSS